MTQGIKCSIFMLGMLSSLVLQVLSKLYRKTHMKYIFKGTKPRISSSVSLGCVSTFSNCGLMFGKRGMGREIQSCPSIQMRNQSHDFPPNIVKELLSSSWCHCIPYKGTFPIFCTGKCHHKPNSLVCCTLTYICCQKCNEIIFSSYFRM